MTLRDLNIGQSAVITEVGGEGALRQHFLDMGVIPGTEVKLIKFAPMGDPMQLLLHGYLLTLRLEDAQKIAISTDIPEREEIKQPHSSIPHPGFGEKGHYHIEDQLRRKEEKQHHYEHDHSNPYNGKITFALAGNQNCGKTTLFNQLTGSNQHVGNFPGVTVDRKSGSIKGYPNTEITDLPGIYSLSPYTAEEIVSRQFILDEHPRGIFNIVDATNIERNLYLTMQLMELGIPMVLALNMMDEIEGNGGTILVNEMEQVLGIPVVPISASKNQGVDELIEHAVHVAQYQETPHHHDFCGPEDHGGAVHRCLHAIMHFIEDHANRANIPVRFAAPKIVEGDPLTIEALKLDDNELQTIEHIICQMEEERGLDRAAAIADMRYSFIRKLCNHSVVKPHESKEQRRSNAVDKLLTGKYTAIPSFVLIMAFIFWFTFNSAGDWIQSSFEELIELGTAELDSLLTRLNVNDVIHSLLIEGICGGVGSVLSFMPLIVLLFFWLSMLEDSGYMARIAFVMDKILRKIGLSGRSIVPMLIGFGCSVPAVMATRTLPSARDRRLTIMLTPFMSCTAKLPIYAFFCAAFFPHNSGMIICSLYFVGIIMGILTALLFKGSLFKGEAVPFVMELPCYRMPGARNTLQLVWEKARDFIQRAFTVIFLASIAIWFLQHFDWHLTMTSDTSSSILASISGTIAPLFEPLGLGDWRWVTALVSGFMAKESVISTLGVLIPDSAELNMMLTTATCYALLIFCLLYTPCVAAIAAIRRELGGGWAAFVVILQCLIAWLCAWAVKLILSALL